MHLARAIPATRNRDRAVACFVRLRASMEVRVRNAFGRELGTAAVTVLLLAFCAPVRAQQYLWADAFGNSSATASSAGVAVDGQGDVVIGGSFSGSVNFGTGATQASGGPDGFVAEYSGVDGRPQWVQHIGGSGAVTNVNAVAADSAGGVYIAGSFTSAVSFPGGSFTSAGSSDAFVMKLDANGAYVWSVKIGGTGGDIAYGVDTDASGNVLVTGYFSGTADFGGTRLVSSGASGFVAKYSPGGQYLWGKALGGGASDWAVGTSVVAGVNGAVAVTGRFSGSVNFGGGALTSAGLTDIFLAMYDTNGTHLWSRALGGAGSDNGSGVAVDGNGNPVITGSFYNNVDFGSGQPLQGASDRASIFVAKYTAGGSYLWAKSFTDVTTPAGYSADVVANGIAVDGSGNIALTGGLTGNVNFGGGLLSGSSKDIFMAEFDASGAYRWAQRFVASFPDAGFGITFDANANVLMAGTFQQAVNFGGGTLSPGSGNAFVAKYGSTTTQNSPTATPTQTAVPPAPTFTFTATTTSTRSATPTQTSTPVSTATVTWTATPTRTFTVTQTLAPTKTWTPTSTATLTFTPTRSLTPTATATATLTRSPTSTPTYTSTRTSTPTWTPTRTATQTFTWTSSPTQTATRTSTPTNTATFTRTSSQTPTNTATLTWSPTATSTRTATVTLTPTRTPTPTSTWTSPPTQTPSHTLTPVATATATSTSTSTWTATPSQTSTMTLSPTPTSTFTPVTAAVSGVVSYFGTGWPVSGATVQLMPPPLQAATAPGIQTDASGQFTFNAATGTNCQIEPQKTGGTNNAVTAFDAVYALQAAVGQRTLNAEQELACDVNGNGAVTAFDASLILQYTVGLINSFPIAQTCESDWAFLPTAAPASNEQMLDPQMLQGSCQPGSIAYQPLLGQVSGQNFTAVLFGDCNGSWQPPAGSAALSAADISPAQVRFGRSRQLGTRLRVPLRVQSSGAFQALEVKMQYDAARLTLRGVHQVGEAQAALVESNASMPGRLAVGLANAQPLHSGTVLVLEFSTRGGRAAASTLRVAQASVH